VGGAGLQFLPHRGRGTARRVVEGPTPQASEWWGLEPLPLASHHQSHTKLPLALLAAPPSLRATSPVGGGIFQTRSRYFIDVNHDAFEILQNIDRSDPKRENPVLRQPLIPPFIPRRLIPAIVRLAVYLHAQLGLVAVKVEIIRACRMLLAPVMAGLQAAQLTPEQYLRQRHFAAQLLRAAVSFAGAFEHVVRSPFALRAPLRQATPATSPRQARGGI
jgi:hypothetical protein